MSQSRARGLTRAILDTFPVVKFGNATVGRDNVDSMGHFKDLESRLDSHGPRDSKIGEWEVMDAPLEMTVHGDGHEKRASIPNSGQGATEVDGNDAEVGQPQASGSRLSTATPPLAHNAEGSSASRSPFAPGDPQDVVPSAIGTETCPICIVDFEEGDDLRLLPCEGKHRFHQECVDPWLLELSSSCPICRHGEYRSELFLHLCPKSIYPIQTSKPLKQ
jgi:hypothetical protein